MIKSLEFSFQKQKFQIYFLKRKDWLWVFHRQDGYQNHIPEPEVRQFLQLSRRTAINWRTGTHPTDTAKLYLLYIHATGRILGPKLIRQGITLDNDTLQYKGRKLPAAMVPEWEYLNWLLQKQNKALKALSSPVPSLQSPPPDPAMASPSYPPGIDIPTE